MSRSLSELKEKIFTIKASSERIFAEGVSMDMVRDQVKTALEAKKTEFVSGILSGLPVDDLVTIAANLEGWWGGLNRPQIVPNVVGAVQVSPPRPKAAQVDLNDAADGGQVGVVRRQRGRPRKVSA